MKRTVLSVKTSYANAEQSLRMAYGLFGDLLRDKQAWFKGVPQSNLLGEPWEQTRDVHGDDGHREHQPQLPAGTMR